jgi:hypothetical protein
MSDALDPKTPASNEHPAVVLAFRAVRSICTL